MRTSPEVEPTATQPELFFELDNTLTRLDVLDVAVIIRIAASERPAANTRKPLRSRHRWRSARHRWAWRWQRSISSMLLGKRK